MRILAFTMRIRPQVGMNQRFWRVLEPGPGLAGLQSRRLMALLVRDCATARLRNYRACCNHSRRRTRPQRAQDRDPASRRAQERSRQCSPPRHCPRAVQTRRRSSVASVPVSTVSTSIWSPPSSSSSLAFVSSSVSEELNKGKIDMEEGLDVLLWFTLGRFNLVVKCGKKRLLAWHQAELG